VKHGRIIVVGSNSEVERLIGKDTRVIDLGGRTVIPGLIDSHCHIPRQLKIQRVQANPDWIPDAYRR